MDIALLERLATPTGGRSSRVADLGCGTGRTGAWLRETGVAGTIDGVDLTPEMLDRARERGAHDSVPRATSARPGSRPAPTTW